MRTRRTLRVIRLATCRWGAGEWLRGPERSSRGYPLRPDSFFDRFRRLPRQGVRRPWYRPAHPARVRRDGRRGDLRGLGHGDIARADRAVSRNGPSGRPLIAYRPAHRQRPRRSTGDRLRPGRGACPRALGPVPLDPPSVSRGNDVTRPAFAREFVERRGATGRTPGGFARRGRRPAVLRPVPAVASGLTRPPALESASGTSSGGPPARSADRVGAVA